MSQITDIQLIKFCAIEKHTHMNYNICLSHKTASAMCIVHIPSRLVNWKFATVEHFIRVQDHTGSLNHFLLAQRVGKAD